AAPRSGKALVMARASLDLALAAHRSRRRVWIAARGLALGALAALLLTLGAVQLAHLLGFERDVVVLLGAGLYVALACVALAAVALPLRRETARRAASALERALPALDGRVATYLQEAQAPSGLVDLLAEDTLERLQPFPPSALIPQHRLALG